MFPLLISSIQLWSFNTQLTIFLKRRQYLVEYLFIFDFYMWPWTWCSDLVVALCTLSQTFEPSYDKNFQAVKKLWGNNKMRAFSYMTFYCDLDLAGSDLEVALCTSSHSFDHLCKVILKTFKEFNSNGADTKCWLFYIWRLSVTLTLGVDTWLLHSAHPLIMEIIFKTFFEFKSYAANTKMLRTDRLTDGGHSYNPLPATGD